MTNLYQLPVTSSIITLLASVLLAILLEANVTTSCTDETVVANTSDHLSEHSTSTTRAPSIVVVKLKKAGEGKKQQHDQLAVGQSKGKNNTRPLLGGGECGRVPIYEKAFRRSIDRSAQEKAARKQAASPGDSRILYGLDAVVGEWPWITRLSLCDATGDVCNYCTGSLINSRWIVTAAHCLTGANTTVATLGLYDLVLPDKSSIKIECDKLIAHPNADMFHNDVALMRLKKPIEYNEFIQPICLTPSEMSANAYELARNKSCYTIGYGLNEEWGFPAKLQKLEIKTAECDKLKQETGNELAKAVCILPKRGDMGGTCRGDSGGPDVCYDEHTNRWFILGVVSFGPSDCNQDSASGNWLTVSVDLANYNKWIVDTMKAND